MSTPTIAQRIKRELPDAAVAADVEKVVKKWLDADDDFNLWFLETTKGSLDDKKLLALVDGYGGDQEAVEEAWDKFFADRDASSLRASLEASLERLEHLKQK